MALIKRVVVGPDEIKLKYFRENGEYRILIYKDGKYDKANTEYYNSEEDGVANFERLRAQLWLEHCGLPDCFSLPVIEHDIFRPDLKDEYTVRFCKTDTKGNVVSRHELRFYMTIQSHSMSVCLNVDFDGIRWHQHPVTEHNRAAAAEFWRMLGDREFKARDTRIGNLRKEADEYFRSLSD